jgi:hypothetical protein
MSALEPSDVGQRRTGVKRVLVTVIATVLLAACSSGKQAASGAAVRVLAKEGCPKTVAGYRDVTNMKNARGSTLLPTAQPTGVLLCGYGSQGTEFKGQRTFTAAQATSLADVINRIHLGRDTGIHSCPPERSSATIFVFTYDGEPDVDLWWHDSGCQSLTNGIRIGTETGNASFYEGFMGEMQRLHR